VLAGDLRVQAEGVPLMVADGTITPFDASITKDMRTAMERRGLFADLIAKLRWNAKDPAKATAVTDDELALMVVCTELVATTIARQIYRLNKPKPKPRLNGPGKADM
jgi:hypothetical protein